MMRKNITADKMVRAASRNVFAGKLRPKQVIGNKKKKDPKYRNTEPRNDD